MMMRIRPELMPELMPRLAAASADPAVLASLGRVLMTRPPWREYFLATLAASGPDPAAIDRVFASRGGDDPLPVQPPLVGAKGASLNLDTSSGFTEADLLVNRQIADRRWGTAYVNWVGTLSPAARTVLGNIYDGQFSFPPLERKISWLNLSSKGFGWQVPDQGTGFDVVIAPRTQFTTDNVLQVTFDGLTLDYRPVKQLLVLGPGHYRLTGMGQAGAMTSEDGLQWVIACAEGKQQVIARSTTFTGDVPWGAFQMEFDVPDTDCGGQWLRLDLGGSAFKGQPIEGGVIFDDLQIVRLGAQVPAAANEQDPDGSSTTTTDATR